MKSPRKQPRPWEVLDPVVLWRKPGTADVYSLSGHSRKEAFKRLAAQGARVEGRGFEAIPAKITDCPQAEAVEIARNSNNLATKETELERAAYYRGLRAASKPRKEVEAAAAGYEGKNKAYILNLSYLAAHGQAVQALASFEGAADGSGKEIVRTLADWTGEARRRFPQLTDRHENEVFDWLRTAYGTKTGQLRNKADFIQRLETTISRAAQFGQFAQDEPLNLANRTGRGTVEQEFDEQLAIAKRAHQQAENALADKRTELVARNARPEDLARILPEYDRAVTRALQELNQVSARKFEVKDAAKNQASLFGIRRVTFGGAMREFITFTDAKGKDSVLGFISALKRPEAEKVLAMLEKLALVDELGRPYFKAFRGFTVTLGELRIGDFRIFVHRLEALPGQERYLLVHMFRKKSNETPHREIETAVKRIEEYRYEHD